MPIIHPSNWIEALALKEKELITLVGAGGKTTLMYALANGLLASRKTIITTTTTKIFPPEPGQSPFLLLGGIEVFPYLEPSLTRYGHLTWAAGRGAGNKLTGVKCSDLSALWTSNRTDYLIIEGDGSARKPIKAPNAREPVVPEETTLFISVIGLSALNRPLNKDQAHRPEIISQLTGMPLDSSITVEGLARLLVHPQGGLKGWLPDMRAVIILNQADREPEQGMGYRLAERIKELGEGRISTVIIR